MDETKLRLLERQYKLRVKTGCNTCRTRRVKCDETKPECLRCTKSGRKCEGYKHSTRSRDQSPATAASFRNPSFLVVPQTSYSFSTSVPRNPSRKVSPETAENRSFYYFQTHTLPQWTELFDSDLWSQKILQLSHIEPAIKHGILALSSLHERFESITPIIKSGTNDFAFEQYMQAVKHSNKLLTAHQEGRVDVEKVLIACIIFTCYENLAGNYSAANMHLRNGLRILDQHRRKLLQHATRPVQESIANVLHRFDLQAMTFSENTAPYEYSLDCPPECPIVPVVYNNIAEARSDLVGLLRCMMWIAGVASNNPHAPNDPTWLHIYSSLMTSFEEWEITFDRYQQYANIHEHGDGKIYAGNNLLKMYAIMARTIVAAGAGMKTELVWDAFTSSFTTMVDLADTLPSLTQQVTPPRSRSSSSSSSSSPPYISPTPSPLQQARPIAPNFATPSPPPGAPHPSSATGFSGFATKPRSKERPPCFTPSFELSPIVPLFVTATRCRDPYVRRRAIALLLNCRRREGVWDSYGAGSVALQVVRLEESIPDTVKIGHENWLPLNPKYTQASDIAEEFRVQDVFVSVNMAQKRIGVNYLMTSGECLDGHVKF